MLPFITRHISQPHQGQADTPYASLAFPRVQGRAPPRHTACRVAGRSQRAACHGGGGLRRASMTESASVWSSDRRAELPSRVHTTLARRPPVTANLRLRPPVRRHRTRARTGELNERPSCTCRSRCSAPPGTAGPAWRGSGPRRSTRHWAGAPPAAAAAATQLRGGADECIVKRFYHRDGGGH